MASAPMDRRAFVRRLPVLGAGLSGSLTALSLSACAGAPYLVPRPEPGGLAVPLTQIGPEGAAFLQTREMERPIYLSRDASGEWSAVLASCTHRGCQPEPVGERLVCPCHGSEFSRDGQVLQGPADRPLTRYPVEEEADRLVVRTTGADR